MDRSTKALARTLRFAAFSAMMTLAAGGQAQSPDRRVDAEGLQRFQHGIQLAKQSRNEAALDVFEQLTRDYPDWPEPYNNLAVLYAARGDEKRAEAALLSALRTHPSYALIYRNLNSLYAGMAERAYRKALESEAADSRAPGLALATDVTAAPSGGIPAGSGPVTVIASATAVRNPTQPAPVTELKSAPSAPEQVANVLAEPLTETLTQTRQPLSAARAGAEPDAGSEREVLDAVASWVTAWSAQDVDRYLSYYGHHFEPGNGVSRERWEEIRRIRLSRPEFIEVRIANPVVNMQAEDRAVVQFLQRYRSNTFEGRTQKTLHMSRSPTGWKIIREQAGG